MAKLQLAPLTGTETIVPNAKYIISNPLQLELLTGTETPTAKAAV